MDHSRSFPVSLLHAWRGQIATISPRGGLRYRVLHQQATLFPRFAAYYAQLRALPKAARRQLQQHWARSLAGVALLFALGHGAAQAAEFTTSNAAELNAAITLANSTAAADTITLTQDIVLTTPADVATDGNTGTVVVKSAITIEGQGHMIRREPGAPEFRLLRVAFEGDLTVRQMTLQGGQVTDYRGGGLLNEGSVTLEECTVSGNSAYHGGGVTSVTFDTSQMTLSNSMISGNSAPFGGGVWSRTHGASQMILSNSMVSDNSAYDGGGVWSRTYDTSQMTLTNSTVSGNSASIKGGGVLSHTFGSGQMTLSNSTLSSNSAPFGGGMFSFSFDASQVALTNSTVSGNSASQRGGGVFDIARDSSELTLSSSTVSGNSALVGGGVSSITYHTSQVMLQRMLIAGNRAESGAEVAQFHYNAGGFFNSTFNLFGHSGLTTADALMGVRLSPTDLLATSDSGFSYALETILNPTLANNGGPTLTHNLVLDSPAIDAGGACDLPTDQRGAPRPQGSACDIGAVEFAEAEEICGNCVDDNEDGLVDFTDPDCTSGTSPITKERATFTLTPTPHSDQLTLTATLSGGSELNPPRDGLGVQFVDEQGQDSLLCVHLPPAMTAPGAWKSTVEGTGQTTWQFKDAPNGSRGDPSKDAGTVSYDPSKDTLTVKLTIKETEIGGDTTARDIRTGIGSGVSRWQRIQRWTAKADGKKLGTP